jgi:4-aminobutyrate aminotransferase/(S)-3-amino-2-methylpropionate transaminase
VPGDSPKKTIFVTTGAEAVENTIKIARAYTGRRGVIAFNGGFHGRTMLAMGLTGKITPYKNLFGPFPGEVYHAPFPIEYHGVSIEESLKALQNLFKADIAPSDVAAIIVEPVQGEGGFYPAPNEFMQALRALCDEHGIVLIADEIQTGFGRTGKFFASEYAGIEPDLVTVAKGVAGGFPLAAVVGKSVERANGIAAKFKARLTALQAKRPATIGEVRCDRGAMIAIELVQDGDVNKPAADLTKALVGAAYEHGLVLLSCGVNGNVIRFLPALTISDALIDEGLDILEACFDKTLA